MPTDPPPAERTPAEEVEAPDLTTADLLNRLIALIEGADVTLHVAARTTGQSMGAYRMTGAMAADLRALLAENARLRAAGAALREPRP